MRFFSLTDTCATGFTDEAGNPAADLVDTVVGFLAPRSGGGGNFGAGAEGVDGSKQESGGSDVAGQTAALDLLGELAKVEPMEVALALAMHRSPILAAAQVNNPALLVSFHCAGCPCWARRIDRPYSCASSPQWRISVRGIPDGRKIADAHANTASHGYNCASGCVSSCAALGL